MRNMQHKTLNIAMFAETGTIQASDAMNLAAVMMNMADMCQGSVKKPLNQVCYILTLWL